MSQSIRVLYVDDDPSLAELVGTALERQDDRIDVVTEGDGGEGLDRLAGERVDCVVSDYEMPGTNGIEFLEAVRERHPDLPFILYTGKGSEAVASDAISAGVTDYLRKSTGTEQYAVLANRIANAVERYRAQRDLTETEQVLATVLDTMPVALCTTDEEGQFTRAEGEALERIGVAPEAAVGKHVGAAFDDGSVVPDHYERALAGERVRGTVEAGDAVFQSWYRPIRSGEGEVTGAVGLHVDVTERRRRERELERRTEQLEAEVERREVAQTRYRSLFENNPVVIWEEDFSAGKRYADDLVEEVDDLVAYFEDNPDELDHVLDLIDVIDVNENALEYYGAESKAELMENLPALLTEESRRANRELWEAVAAGQTQFRTETVSLGLDGERHDEILELYVPEPYAEDYSRVYITVTRITERKERERELERKNERLEEFASVVSHDLRNPLEVARGRLELAREECESEHLDELAGAHDRMETLIDDLFTLARTGEDVADPDRVRIPAVVGNAWNTVATDGASLVTETDRAIRADRGRFRQLLENLIRNSVEHSSTGNRAKPGDSVEHSSTDSRPSAGDVTITVGELDDGPGIYVEDDGPGIPPGDRERVFESGHSTDESGAGFGLAIVREVAEAHGWSVSVTEGDEGGARFEIRGVEFVG
ncbi:hybrid sensor histidine kinase/response regulator [Halobacteriales archaeon QS_8_69_26]|nr:MAG: hybrid sensor histidine kinase/response regulator [Halobacteriales archaeon QS_8_69_26]